MNELMAYLLKIDYSVLHFFNTSLANSFFDWFFPAITDLYKALWFKLTVYPFVGFLYYRKFSIKGLFLFAGLILTLGFNDLIGGQFVKKHFERPRPFQNQEIEVHQKSPASGFSFYSNHASNSTAFATYTLLTLPVLGYFGIVIAILITMSRVYNGVHYPSDVLAGALAGFLVALLIAKCVQYFIRTKLKTRENQQ